MRVCFIVEYYYPWVGGSEVLFQHLSEGLVKAGHSCDVVTCALPYTKRHETINGVHVHRIRVPKLGDRYWFTFWSLLFGWKYAQKAEILYTSKYNGVFPTWLVSKVQKKRAVHCVLEVLGRRWHEIGLNPFAACLWRTLESLAFSLPFDAYLCISKSTMKSLAGRGIPTQKIFLAYPGIDYDLFNPEKYQEQGDAIRGRLGLKRGTFLYTYFGRPGFTKGVEYLVRAVPYVKERIPSSKLLLILAKKPESGYKRVLELIQELGLKRGRDVTVMDSVPREELPSYIQASDSVVVPSLTEGFGFTCVEACTMRRPVVSTDAGSLPEVIFGRYVIIRPGDPVEIVRGLEKVYRHECTISEDKIYLWEDTVKNCVKVSENLIRPRQNLRKLKIDDKS
jgi:D-inositol-3-phosphate glycosyltransferase